MTGSKVIVQTQTHIPTILLYQYRRHPKPSSLCDKRTHGIACRRALWVMPLTNDGRNFRPSWM